MNINDYVIHSSDKKYIKDSKSGKNYAFDSVKNVSSPPSRGDLRVLYIANGVRFYINGGSSMKEIIPAKVEVIEETKSHKKKTKHQDTVEIEDAEVVVEQNDSEN